MRDPHREMRKWQREQFRRYEWYAARRTLANALFFLLVFTIMMTVALVAAEL